METLVHASVAIPRAGRILVVREGKEPSRGRWNLPGGRLEPGETVQACARREAREETGFAVLLSNLVGVYTGIPPAGAPSIRFVFRAAPVGGEESPGEEILEMRWATVAELRAHPDGDLAAPESLRAVLDDLEAGTAHPLAVLREPPGRGG